MGTRSVAAKNACRGDILCSGSGDVLCSVSALAGSASAPAPPPVPGETGAPVGSLLSVRLLFVRTRLL